MYSNTFVRVFLLCWKVLRKQCLTHGVSFYLKIVLDITEPYIYLK